jgi:hypothetical protein
MFSRERCSANDIPPIAISNVFLILQAVYVSLLHCVSQLESADYISAITPSREFRIIGSNNFFGNG